MNDAIAGSDHQGSNGDHQRGIAPESPPGSRLADPGPAAGMKDPPFQFYSLAMFCEGQRIFMSREGGLKPLVEWLAIYEGKFRGCVLHDRVVGLAAARLIAYSGMVSRVVTLLSSRPAREFLDGEGIVLEAVQTVDNILTPARSAVCPGEVIALETPDRQEFLSRIYVLLKIDPLDYENCRGKCGYTPWCRECMAARGLR